MALMKDKRASAEHVGSSVVGRKGRLKKAATEVNVANNFTSSLLSAKNAQVSTPPATAQPESSQSHAGTSGIGCFSTRLRFDSDAKLDVIPVIGMTSTKTIAGKSFHAYNEIVTPAEIAPAPEFATPIKTATYTRIASSTEIFPFVESVASNANDSLIEVGTTVLDPPHEALDIEDDSLPQNEVLST